MLLCTLEMFYFYAPSSSSPNHTSSFPAEVMWLPFLQTFFGHSRPSLTFFCCCWMPLEAMPKKGKARKIKTAGVLYKCGVPRTMPRGLCYIGFLLWNSGVRIQETKQKSQRLRKSMVHVVSLEGQLAKTEGLWTNVEKITREEIWGVCGRLVQELMEAPCISCCFLDYHILMCS